MLQKQMLDRVSMVVIGAVSGLAAWALIDILPDFFENNRVILLLSSFCCAFFLALLAANGPLQIRRAIVASLGVSLIPALLLFWASFRFAEVDDFLETVHPLMAFVLMVSVPLPFLVATLETRQNWNHYPALFSHAWNFVVRYGVSMIFVGVFWGVVYLSDALLQIVGIDIIETLLDIDVVPYVLTGASLGLAMAVVHELRAYVSPFLVLRLLRLFLPVVLVVVAVFVVAVPIRGVSDLFGDLSAGGILMAMAIAAITLITTAIDQTDADAVAAGWARHSARLLGLLSPILAGLAAYAIWLRVVQHGWSPDRLAAAAASAFILVYALIYAISMLRGIDWMHHIRSANITMAGLVVAVSALWLSPVLNPERISASSQLSRYSAGKTALENLDLWAIGREWGRAGEASLPKFAAAIPENSERLTAELVLLADASAQYSFRRQNERPSEDQIATLQALLPVRPAGQVLPDISTLDYLGADIPITEILASCERKTPQGNPACVAIRAELLSEIENDVLVLIWRSTIDGSLEMRALEQTEPGVWQYQWLGTLKSDDLDIGSIDAVLSGGYFVGPSQTNVLHIGGAEFFMQSIEASRQ